MTITDLTMKTHPSLPSVLLSLLRADFVVLWRQRKSAAMSLILPLVILISWKAVVEVAGGAFVLGTCLTMGLVGIGVLGYTGLVARDRERGVFQRLRAAPIPSWTIMASRLLVQLCVIWVMVCIILAFGHFIYQIPLTVGGVVVTIITSVLAGSIFLALGQAIVGLISASDSVNSTARLLSLPVIVVGGFGELGYFGEAVKFIVKWSPFGVAESLLQFAVAPTTWDSQLWLVLLLTVVYAAFFAYIGIRWFKWRTL